MNSHWNIIARAVYKRLSIHQLYQQHAHLACEPRPLFAAHTAQPSDPPSALLPPPHAPVNTHTARCLLQALDEALHFNTHIHYTHTHTLLLPCPGLLKLTSNFLGKGALPSPGLFYLITPILNSSLYISGGNKRRLAPMMWHVLQI